VPLCTEFWCFLVRLGAMWISNPNHSFCYRYSVRCRGVQGCALSSQIGLKIRRPQGRGGSSPPPGTSKIKQFLPLVGLRQSGSHPLVGSGYWIAEVEVIRLQRTVRDGMKRAYGIEALWGGGCHGIPRRGNRLKFFLSVVASASCTSCTTSDKNRGSLRHTGRPCAGLKQQTIVTDCSISRSMDGRKNGKTHR
jgi:hypothetical protein